jgi:hypothetical protein
MKRKRYKGFLILIFFISSKILTAGWTNMNTGITDNLNAVCFWNNNGILAGDKGVYYTTSGGNGAASWKRFTIAGNPADLSLYNNCKFFKIASTSTNKAYICGWDSVNNKAVILHFDVEHLTYAFNYIGPFGSKLNDIKYGYSLYAVGDNGLIIKSDLSTFDVMPSNTTKNLLSIGVTGTHVSIGGINTLLYGSDDNVGFNLSSYDYPGAIFKDVSNPDYFSGSTFYGVGDTFYRSFAAKTLTKVDDYDFGPLDGKTITISGTGEGYVGTSHGIFKTTSSYSFLELQPSSTNYDINDIEFDPNGNAYATGNNGILLSTTDGGGVTKPYASLNLQGVCTNEIITFTGNMGTASKCRWQINDSVVSSNCYYWLKFALPGQYKINYIVTNDSGLSDTAEQIIHVVDPPQNNLHVTVSNTILCKKGTITITIDSTQNDFIYRLIRNSNNEVYGSGKGNGGQLIFKSELLTESDSYYINVQSLWSNCNRDFKDSIKLVIEKTKAVFHTSLINATPSEGVDFFEKSKDAQHFFWDFSAAANPSQDSTGYPSGIKYKNLGHSNVKLIVWSDHGCYDTIISKGPNIYFEPVKDDSCWAFNLDGNDATWQGHYTPDVSQQILTADGYLIAGTYYQNLFTTRIGDSFGRTSSGGPYIAKYSRNGVLKWIDYGISPNYDYETLGNRPLVASMATNLKTGSIYALGRMRSEEYFYANDSLKLANNPTFAGINSFGDFVVKLNSSGRVIWNATLWNLGGWIIPKKIKEDNSGNLVIMGSFINEMHYYANGKDTLLYPGIHAKVSNTYLIKLDSNGVIKWSTYFEDNYTNGGCGVSDFDIDEQNNILITGGVEFSLTFHSVNKTATNAISLPPNSYGAKLYIVKYSAGGDFDWSMHGDVEINSGGIYSYAIVSDVIGNSYISGRNGCWDSAFNFVITNSDNSIYKANVGGYFLLKVNPSGKVMWSNGSKLAFYGYGFAISIKSDEVSVLGTAKNNSTPWSGIMTSTDGNDLNYSISEDDFFIANYNTDGVLKSILNTGPNQGTGMFEDEGYFSLLRDDVGDYFLSGNIRTYEGGLAYKIGTDSIKTNGWDAFMAKMGKSCNNIIVTGIENQSNTFHANQVDIYPNPVIDNLTILVRNFSKEYDLKIYNINGACVYSKHVFSPTFNLNKREFTNGKSGMYFINFTSKDDEFHFSKKIVVID